MRLVIEARTRPRYGLLHFFGDILLLVLTCGLWGFVILFRILRAI